MNIYEIDVSYDLKAGEGKRAVRLAEMFGVGTLLTRREVVKGIEIKVERGKVTCIVGPSGCGKSSVMRELKSKLEADGSEVCDVDELEFDEKLSLVDGLAEVTLDEAMRSLCKVGLAEVYLMMASYEMLSVGERFRYRLVRAIMEMADYIFIDEFCGCLDDVSAMILCANVRRVADELGVGFVVAGGDNRLSRYLEGDYLVEMGGGNSDQ